jgi:hypothetical protein
VTRVGDVNQKVPSLVNLAGSPTLAYTGTEVSPSLTILGSTTPPTYSYRGVDGTSYGPSSNAPTTRGRYELTVTTADDATWSGTTNKFYYSVGTFNAFKDFWWNRTNGQSAWIDPAQALAQGRGQGTPTAPNAWSYGLIDCGAGKIDAPNVDLNFRPLVGYAHNPNSPSWTYHDGNPAGTRVSWIATNSNNAVLALAPSAGTEGADGSAATVRWTAPAAGTYRFQGSFVSLSTDSMSVAIQTVGNNTEPNSTFLSRTNVAPGASQSFDIVQALEESQTVTWVVGSDGVSTGDVMLLSASVYDVAGGNLQTPTITWTNPAAITYGTPLSATQLNATSSAAGTFTYNPASGAILDVGTNTLTAVFTPSDLATYNSTTNTVSLVVNPVAPAGPTFSSAYPGKALDETAPNGLKYLMNYAFGGNSTIPPQLPVQDTSDPTKLTLYAFVRTNDNTVTVVGETGTTLTSWNTNAPVAGVRTTDQTGAPDGTERRAFTVNASGDRLFLRLKATQ